MKVRIVEHSLLARIAAWKLGAPSMALTLGRTIYLHHANRQQLLSNGAWIRHELAHAYQYRKYGLLAFLLLYLWESRKGYYLNRFEMEARAAEKNNDVLEHITFT